MVHAYIGLGSNLGDRKKNIDNSIRLLGKFKGIEVDKRASFYETEPVGPTQPWFINTAVEIETGLPVDRILELCKEVERRIGRVDSLEWGPRLVDLDILLVGNRVVKGSDLQVPHPEIANRAFVILPLLELDPDLVHPKLNMPIKKLLDETERNKKVMRLQ